MFAFFRTADTPPPQKAYNSSAQISGKLSDAFAKKMGLPNHLHQSYTASFQKSEGVMSVTARFEAGFRKVCVYDDGKIIVTDGIREGNLKLTNTFYKSGEITTSQAPLIKGEPSDAQTEKIIKTLSHPDDNLKTSQDLKTMILDHLLHPMPPAK